MKVLVFDTETTGLPIDRNAPPTQTEKWPHIVQIGFVLYETETGEVISYRDDIIKIGNSVELTDESVEIHKITREITKDKGVSLRESIGKFNEALCEAHVIVAHNLEFDKKMIMVECIRLGENNYFNINGVPRPEFCTMQRSIDICKIEKVNPRTGKTYFKWPRLSELYEHLFCETPKGCHNAVADVIFCLRCYVKIKFGRDIFINASDRLNLMYNMYCA
jgi:DNA polymerase III epsilon subunit-like protein